jgi:hypothetical protein
MASQTWCRGHPYNTLQTATKNWTKCLFHLSKEQINIRTCGYLPLINQRWFPQRNIADTFNLTHKIGAQYITKFVIIQWKSKHLGPQKKDSKAHQTHWNGLHNKNNRSNTDS